MLHDRSYHRSKDFSKRNRKLKIIKHIWHKDAYEYAVNNKGRFVKGKIHCSCPMCNGAFKRRVSGPPISERRRLEYLE